MKILACAILLSLVSIPATAQDQVDLIDNALSQVDMTAADLKFDQDEMALWGGDDYFTLKFFRLFHRNPLKLPKYGALYRRSLSDAVTNPTSLVSQASRLIDYPIYRSLIGEQLTTYLDYPDSVPVPSITQGKLILPKPEFAALRERIDLLYRIADDDESYFNRGIDGIDDKGDREKLFEYFINDNDEYHDLIYELYEKADFSRMVAGAQDFAEAIRRAADGADTLAFPSERERHKTRAGLIVIGTAKDEVYEYQEPPFLILDGGGNDVYKISGYNDDYPVTIIIDVGGDDQYISDDSTVPGIGGAIIGISAVVDLHGNDTYTGYNVTQGAGIFGFGVVIDHEGSDVYSARNFAQGAATFGIGICADSAGNDSLYCISSAQGFGYSGGCGLLVNFAGDDSYVAEDDTVINASPQTAEHNTSLAQGVGFGKRADYLDGHSWGGGVGILCDDRGADTYSAGLFAQGCAYWYAIGMLLDGGGADRYDGVWYVQGSGAHFGVGYLDDFGGDDTYTATRNMAVGAGHDFTVGYFNERGGNDTYTVPNLSLGGGNANGIGIFHDHAGDDRYTTNGGTTLGRANASDKGPRQYLQVFGIFIDGGGADTYDQPWASNAARWISPLSSEGERSPYEIGVGIDVR